MNASANPGRQPSPGPSSEGLEKSVLLHRFLHLLFRRKWTIGGVFLLVFVAVCFFTFLITPTWNGTALVAVEGQPKTQWAPFTDLATPSPHNPGDATVQNLVAILASQSMADAVVDEFDLAERLRQKSEEPRSPRDKIKKSVMDVLLSPIHLLQSLGILSDEKSWKDKAVDEFEKDWLTVGVVEGTQVVGISVDCPSIEMARTVPNRMVALLEQRLKAFRREEMQAGLAQVTGQIAGVQEELAAARQRLQDQKTRKGVLDLEEIRKTRTRNLEDLRLEESQARDDAMVLQRRLEKVREQLDGRPTTYISSTVEELNPAIAQLKDKLTDLQVSRAGLSARRTEADKSYQALVHQIDEVQARLASEQALVVGSQVESPDPVYLEILGREALLEAEVFAVEAKVSGLTAMVQRLELQVARMTEDEVLFQVLQSDIDLLAGIASGLETRQREMQMLGDAPPAEFTLRVTPAVAYDRASPDWPLWPLNIVVALFLGLALGLGWPLFVEYWSDSFATAMDAERALGVPVLGLVPPLGLGNNPKKALPLAGGRLVAPLQRTSAALLAQAQLHTPPTLLVQVEERSPSGLGEMLGQFLGDGAQGAPVCVLTHRKDAAGLSYPHTMLPDLGTLLTEEGEPELQPGVNFIPLPDTPQGALLDRTALGALFSSLARRSSLVLVGPLSARDPLTMVCAPLAGGLVWVLEAEGSRRAHVVAARGRLDPGQDRSVGLLLVQHRPRIPRFLRRWFHLDEQA